MSPNTEFIPFARPSIREEEEEAAIRVLRSGWLTTGREAEAFEKEFTAFISTDAKVTALAVSSATAGLHLALESLGIGPGDRVAVPVYTFTATAEVVRYLGADPVFVDVSERTGNIDPAALRKVWEHEFSEKSRIKAIIPVHLGGLPCDMAEILSIVSPTGTAVVEDAAHALPCLTAGGHAGTLGDVGVYSFYATKTITTGEGGMVVTRRNDLIQRITAMRLHGIDRDVWDRYGTAGGAHSWRYDVVAPGYKYNLNDIAAAIGRVQLRRAGDLLEERRRIAARYAEELSDVPWIELPEDHPAHAWHLYAIAVPEIDRDRLVEELHRSGIGTSVHYIPLHRMSYWKKRYRLAPEEFPAADTRYRKALSLPIWPGLGGNRQSRVVDALRNFRPRGPRAASDWGKK